MSDPSAIVSPCVNVCVLDVDDTCLGCYRTSEEIAQWVQYTDEERHAAMDRVRERELADES